MNNAHVVEVFDSIQNLLNELTGIFLCVEALLYDTIKEFPAGHPRDAFIKVKSRQAQRKPQNQTEITLQQRNAIKRCVVNILF